MKVVTVPPSARAQAIYLEPDLCDAYAMETPGALTPAEAARLIFALTPGWVGALMKLRNIAVRPFGLIASEGKLPAPESRYGMFPVITSAADHMVLGLNDRHLDFRILLEVDQGDAGMQRVTLATAVKCHNSLGRAYLAVVRPFHQRIVPAMLAQLAATRSA